MNSTSPTSATTDASLPAWIESAPSSGPMVRSSRKVISAGSAPARRSTASWVLSSTVKLPVMIPDPPAMWLWITGAEITSPSSTIAKGSPIWAAV